MPRQQHMASLVDGHGPTEIFEAGNCEAWDAGAAGGPVPATSSLSLSINEFVYIHLS